MQGKLLVISGPSAGVGKDTLYHMFRNAHPDWLHPPSTTTRPPRPNEVQGKDMNFLTREAFEDKIKKDDFFEYFEVDGNYYGTLREPVMLALGKGQNVVLRKDVKGAVEIKKILPDSTIIFLAPESLEVLKIRMRKRKQQSDEEIDRRLKLAEGEMLYKDNFDKVVVNPEGHPERALHEIESALGLE